MVVLPADPAAVGTAMTRLTRGSPRQRVCGPWPVVGFPLPRLVAGQSSKVVVVDDAGRVPCGCPVGVLVVLVLADCPDLDPRQVLAGGVAFGAIGLGVPQSIRKKCRDVEHPRS